MPNLIDRWFENRKVSPFKDLSEIQDSFDRVFHDFMNLKRRDGSKDLIFSPSCEVTEEGKNYVMKFDIPGVTKDQVKVEVEKDQLTVRAERREEKKQEDKKKYMSEIYYGSYLRSFTLPGPVDDKKVEAKFENGVLTVTIPKTESVAAKEIPIH